MTQKAKNLPPILSDEQPWECKEARLEITAEFRSTGIKPNTKEACDWLYSRLVEARAMLKRLGYVNHTTRPIATPGKEFCSCRWPKPENGTCAKCMRRIKP